MSHTKTMLSCILFDFNKALTELQSGKGLTGEDGVLTPLIKQLTEAALKAKLEQMFDLPPYPCLY